MTPKTRLEPTARDTPERTRLCRDITRLALVGVFFGAAIYLLSRPDVRTHYLDAKQVRADFAEHGWLGHVAFVAAGTVALSLGVPRTWINAAAGGLYGALLGATVGQLTTLLGASVNFFLGRSLLRGPVRRLLPGRWAPWYERFNANGFRWILYLRMVPISNATVVNLACGASKVRFRTFLGATFLGYLPLTVVFAVLGSAATESSGWKLGLGLGVFAVLLAAQFLLRRRGAKDLPEEEIVAGNATSTRNASASPRT